MSGSRPALSVVGRAGAPAGRTSADRAATDRASTDRASTDRASTDHASASRASAVLRRIEWTVLRRLDGILQGDYRTLFRGAGLDLADLREYVAHDDVRHIDWNVTARMRTPYVREFQEDREVAAWFLVDLSASVDFGSSPVRKRDVAIDLTAALAQALARHGNRVGALLYAGGRVDVVPARAGRRHLLFIIDRMLAEADTRQAEPVGRRGGFWRRRRAASPPAAVSTDLQRLLTRAQAVVARRSVMFVLSDFISEPGWEKPLAALARRHEVVAIHLLDPLEVALPDLGLVVMQDAESGEQLFVDTHDEAFRRRFAQAAADRDEALGAAFGRAGVDALALSTDEPIDQVLLRFIRLRKARARLAGGSAVRGVVP
ncbi:MAG: DUF58 domain-containing protein [Burkholderiaceae bacterium]